MKEIPLKEKLDVNETIQKNVTGDVEIFHAVYVHFDGKMYEYFRRVQILREFIISLPSSGMLDNDLFFLLPVFFFNTMS